MQTKTTRAFRTISEAAEELDLQPHVLRFWESKFSQIRPIKRAGGRRLYRPEDIDLLRGIKILLHEEKHPIKDVQKIIRLKGPNQLVELGRSIKPAARPLDVTDTVLIPERINTAPRQNDSNLAVSSHIKPAPILAEETEISRSNPSLDTDRAQDVVIPSTAIPAASVQPAVDISKLKAILLRLEELKAKWDHIDFKSVE